MKKGLLTALAALLFIASSVHCGVAYLNYLRTIGLGFAPATNLALPQLQQHARKDIFKVENKVISKLNAETIVKGI